MKVVGLLVILGFSKQDNGKYRIQVRICPFVPILQIYGFGEGMGRLQTVPILQIYGFTPFLRISFAVV